MITLRTIFSMFVNCRYFRGQNNANESEEEEITIDAGLDPGMGGVCSTSPWGQWSVCSETCGIGLKMRTRFFVDDMGRKKCPHISTGNLITL